MQTNPQEQLTTLEEARAALEAMMPSTERIRRRFIFDPIGAPEPVVWDCIQDQLGFGPVQEFVTLIGETIEGFAQGDMGRRIGELFGVDSNVQLPETFDAETVQQTVEDNMPLVEAFFKLIRIVPELEFDIICMSLGVEPGRRDLFKSGLKLPPVRGGLTVDEGFELLNTFVKQNAKLIRRFFEEKGAEFIALVQSEVLGEETVDSTATEETPAVPDSPGSMLSSTSSPATQVSVS